MPTLNERAPEAKKAATRLAALSAAPVGLLGLIVGLVVGFLIGGAVIAIVLGVVLAALAAVLSVLVLRSAAVPGLVKIVGARPLGDDEFPRYDNLVESLCITGGVPEPTLYVIDDDHPNLMALGAPDEGVLVATSGLFSSLDRVELEGVLAEGLARIRSYDAYLAGQAATFIVRPLLHNGPDVSGRPMWMVTPFAAWRARQLATALGEQRHLLADLSALAITNYPPALRDALSDMAEAGTAIHDCSWGTAHLWMCDPLQAAPDGSPEARLNELFTNHPPLEHRIALLDEL